MPFNFVNRHLPFLIFLAPVVTVNLAYIVASSLNHIPDCITYVSGCTSISSTGRIMPQKGIFLLGMIPTAIFSMMFWMRAEDWLANRRFNSEGGHRPLIYAGAIASFFLLVYVTTLGIPGSVYTLTRKFAVLLYFGFTFIAQLLLSKQLFFWAERNQDATLKKLAAQLKWLCFAMLVVGILIVPISLIEDAILRKKIENIIEWNFAFVLHIYYLLVYRLWKRRGPA